LSTGDIGVIGVCRKCESTEIVAAVNSLSEEKQLFVFIGSVAADKTKGSVADTHVCWKCSILWLSTRSVAAIIYLYQEV
jgi:hypothetical protein